MLRKVIDYEFRAWDETTEQMVHFTLGDIRSEYRNGFYYGNYIENEGRKIYLTAEGGQNNPDLEVMQYTGLRDINGVKIFEGDYIYHHWHKDTAYLVWHERYICFVGKPFEEDTSTTYHYQKPDEPDLEVIGNVHENPELLEVEE